MIVIIQTKVEQISYGAGPRYWMGIPTMIRRQVDLTVLLDIIEYRGGPGRGYTFNATLFEDLLYGPAEQIKAAIRNFFSEYRETRFHDQFDFIETYDMRYFYVRGTHYYIRDPDGFFTWLEESQGADFEIIPQKLLINKT